MGSGVTHSTLREENRNENNEECIMNIATCDAREIC